VLKASARTLAAAGSATRSRSSGYGTPLGTQPHPHHLYMSTSSIRLVDSHCLGQDANEDYYCVP